VASNFLPRIAAEIGKLADAGGRALQSWGANGPGGTIVRDADAATPRIEKRPPTGTRESGSTANWNKDDGPPPRVTGCSPLRRLEGRRLGVQLAHGGDALARWLVTLQKEPGGRVYHLAATVR